MVLRGAGWNRVEASVASREGCGIPDSGWMKSKHRDPGILIYYQNESSGLCTCTPKPIGANPGVVLPGVGDG